MNPLMQLLENIAAGQVITVMAACYFVVSVLIKAYHWTETLHHKKDQLQEIKNTVDTHEHRLCNVEGELIDFRREVKTEIKGVRDDIGKNAHESRLYRKISLADKIYRKFIIYVRRGWLTNSEMVNFKMCVEQYIITLEPGEEQADIVIDKYLHEVMKLDIKKTEEE